jgi:hypothetical protein
MPASVKGTGQQKDGEVVDVGNRPHAKVFGMIAAVLLLSFTMLSQTGSSPKPASPIGDWRGLSACQVKPSGCRDEDSL